MASKQRQPSAKNANSDNTAERSGKRGSDRRVGSSVTSGANRAATHRAARRAQQYGGTFLGVVLGLIVGLAIAVVVALYITRAPTPFVSRNAPASDASATGASSGNTDPNRPLAGATPGQAVPQSAQPSPPNTAPGQPANPSTGLLDEPKIVEVPASAPDNTSTAPSSPSTQGQWPNSHPAPSTTGNTPSKSGSATASSSGPTSADNANTGYFLQAGAYRTEADADQQRGNLAMLGFSATVTRRDSGSVTFYRVRLGPFAKFDDMNAARQNLSSKGVDTAVIRFTRQP